MPTLAEQIAPQRKQPEGLGGWLSSIADEAMGAFERYGRRSGAQRDASLALLNQASAPGTDPIMGAGQKLLGLAGLITHPLAFFPTREEWDQRLQAAGNDGRMSRSIGGFLSDLPSLIDPQMAAGGAATVAPAIFAGMMAKTADLNKLKQAEKLAELGHAASDIRDMTGLHKGPDGKWRFEISDADATMKMSLDDLPNSSGRLGDVLKHDPLYEAYPDLKNAIVWNTGQRGGGYLSPKVSDIGREEILAGGGTLDDQKSVLLHEIMHGIQDREGFAGGAAFKGGGGADEWDRYFRDAGEVEARNVQSRMNMSAADLADETNAPWWTQDVPYSQQILSGGGGTPSSVSREQPQRRQLTTQSYKETLPDGTTRWVPGTLRSNPTTAPRFEPDMSIAEIKRYIETFGEPPQPRAKGELVTGKRKDVYPDGTVKPVPGLLRTKRPASLGEALQATAPLAAKMAKPAASAVRVLPTDVTGYSRGESFGTKLLKVDDAPQAAADLSILGDTVYINNIETLEGSRRSGLASKLLDDIFAEFPDKKIAVTNMTDDGSNFFRKNYAIDEDGVLSRKGN